MIYSFTKLYHRATYYYQSSRQKNLNNKFSCLRLFVVLLQTCNSCIIMYMMVLMFGQSLMVTGVTVIVLHAIITPYYNVLHEAISYCFHGN